MANDFNDIEPLNNQPLPVAYLIGSVALNLALKWHDMTLIKDGVMYQQKKMEGANITHIDLPDVLETAKVFERHLMASSERVAEIVVDALVHGSNLEKDGD